MAAYGLEPQVALTTPLLLSWDGTRMSSSRGNYIGLSEPADDQFGKTMRIPDDLLEQWWSLVAEQPVPEGEPMSAKLQLARWIVGRSWGPGAAAAAEAHFTRVVREGQAPAEVPEHDLPAGDPVHLPAVLGAAFGLSTSEARRLIGQGAVRVNGEPVGALDHSRESLAGALVQAGKRRFVRLRDAA
jgi:tyrosyl-tRNA synthetase